MATKRFINSGLVNSRSSWVIRPTGSAAGDVAELTKARAFFEARNGGTLLVDGRIKLTDARFSWNLNNANMPVSAIGISPDAGFEYTGPSSELSWGGGRKWLLEPANVGDAGSIQWLRCV